MPDKRKRSIPWKTVVTIPLVGMVLMAIASIFLPSLEPIVTTAFLGLFMASFYGFLFLVPILAIYTVWRFWRYRTSRNHEQRKTARKALMSALILLLLMSSCQGCRYVNHHRFIRKYESVALRLQPVIDAIESYHENFGEYPESMEALVPDYLEVIPTPGVGRDEYSKLKYRVDENGFVVMFFTPEHFFDSFVYRSDGDYRFEKVGGMAERIGRWAYVHE